ncbi:MAG TPA: ABC transporter permease [Rhizobium sp.]|nr:ABC transporter permease [Rhizobium sp.]
MSARELRGRSRLVAFAGCLVWFFLSMFPIYWVAITSFKSPRDVVSGPTYLPFVDFIPTLNAWRDLLSGLRGEFFSTFWASAMVSVSSSLLATLIGTMAAYALCRFEFRVRILSGVIFFALAMGGFLLLRYGVRVGPAMASILAFGVALAVSVFANRFRLPGKVMDNDDIVFWFVSQRLFPPIVVAFALYLLYSEIGKLGFKLNDSYAGLTLAYIAFSLPIVVWLMRDFINSLPVDVEEAALVDNVPQWRIFFGIVLPMARPGLIATFVITLAFTWNEFLFALFLTSSKWQTLPILIAGQNSQRGDEWWAISAAALVAIIPMIIIAGLLGRLMRSGLLAGAVK